jgi:glycosyltransferase involved in cell wall biosynthesis
LKIALVDNMNNNFFSIARYFIDMGIDTTLYLIPGSIDEHFLPQNDTFKDIRTMDWIKYFPSSYSWSDSIFPRVKEIHSEFSKYDHVIACGFSVGLLHHSGIRISLFIPYGGDLCNTPFIRVPNFRQIIKAIPRTLVNIISSRMQSGGIRDSNYVITNRSWEVLENSLKRLKIEKYRVEVVNLPRLMIYPEDCNHKISKKWDFMSNYDFIVFSPSRHLWKTNNDLISGFKRYGGIKRNDKLIRAFARVVHDGIYTNPCLILFEYGDDVDASKNLIEEYEINSHVTWLPLMPRKELTIGMAKASLVADQFRKGMSSTSAGVTNEALSVGVPVVTNTDGAISNPDDPYFNSPIIETLNEDDIYSIFLDYAKSCEKYREIGLKSKKWFQDNLGIGLAKQYMTLLNKIV